MRDAGQHLGVPDVLRGSTYPVTAATEANKNNWRLFGLDLLEACGFSGQHGSF